MISTARRLASLVRSLVLLAACAVAVPAGLLAVARARFGGGAPWHGITPVSEWSIGQFLDALGDRLTERIIADVVIRLSLVVVWAAVIVLMLTVVAETAHMARHGGMHLPDIRGLGLTQRGARVIAAGLLVLVPLVTSPGRVAGGALPALTTLPRSAPAPVTTADLPGSPAVSAATDVTRGAGQGATQYIVQPGDSIYAISARLAGPGQDVDAYADRMLELNLGRTMGDGRRFTNAALIDVGWVLTLPTTEPEASTPPAHATHVVTPGESLWSIADDELGDGVRWPELYQANAGRTFADGRTLEDPSLIQPGWELSVPGRAPEETTPAPTTAPGADTPAEPADVPTLVDRLDTPEAVPPGTVDMVDSVDVVVGVVPRPDNVWVEGDGADRAAALAVDPAVEPRVESGGAPRAVPTDAEQVPQLLTIRRSVMLTLGVLTLIGVRRRRSLRQAAPRAPVPVPSSPQVELERSLRAMSGSERVARVDIASRAVALPLIEHQRRLLAIACAATGEMELYASGPASLPAPWTLSSAGMGERWVLPGEVTIDALAEASRQVAAPSPTLIQLGVDDAGREVYVDLEAFEAIEVGGAPQAADAIVAAIAATLAGSPLAEATPLVSVAIPTDAFLGHRLHQSAADPAAALSSAAATIGRAAHMPAPLYELRARATAGEAWEPCAVLIGTAAGEVHPPANRRGLALVSAAPIIGVSSRLAPEGGEWVLRPLGLRLEPIGLVPDDITALAELVAATDAGLDQPPADDHTIYIDDDWPSIDTRDDDDGDPASRGAHAGWTLLVRLYGPVTVESVDGRSADFERSKTRELVAWMATHRQRSTRSNARAALWEHDVRDATFANVVSEARRALTRCVAPPEGQEWLERTLNDALPLHPAIRTDAELLQAALDAARLQPPSLAIATLGPAVELIAGLPFEGTSYLWPDAEGLTSNLVVLAVSAAAELAAHHLSVGDVVGVFAATGRGLQVLPGHEELIALRMRAHAQAGDLAGVRDEWERYERTIHADPWSDGEPSPKLVELRQQLLNPSR